MICEAIGVFDQLFPMLSKQYLDQISANDMNDPILLDTVGEA